MHFNVKVFKGKPVLYGGVAIVFFLVVLHFLNKNAGTGTADTVITNGGPTDAQVASQTQLALASMSSQVELANVNAQLQAVQIQAGSAADLATIATSADLVKAHIDADTNRINTDASLAALHEQLLNAAQMNEDNNNFQIGYSKLAYDSANTQVAISANLQRDLATQQLQAFQTSSFLSAISMFKKKDAKLAIANLAGQAAGLIPSSPASYALPGNSPAVL